MLYRHYAGNNKSFPDFVLKGEKMRCENCNGIGIVNLYEKTGENISTDCHLCNGTGQISHPVEEQSQFNDWFREVEEKDVLSSSREKAAKGMKPLALLLSAILALPAYAQPDTTTPPPAPLTLYERAVMGTPVPARLLRAVAIVEAMEAWGKVLIKKSNQREKMVGGGISQDNDSVWIRGYPAYSLFENYTFSDGSPVGVKK